MRHAWCSSPRWAVLRHESPTPCYCCALPRRDIAAARCCCVLPLQSASPVLDSAPTLPSRPATPFPFEVDAPQRSTASPYDVDVDESVVFLGPLLDADSVNAGVDKMAPYRDPHYDVLWCVRVSRVLMPTHHEVFAAAACGGGVALCVCRCASVSRTCVAARGAPRAVPPTRPAARPARATSPLCVSTCHCQRACRAPPRAPLCLVRLAQCDAFRAVWSACGPLAAAMLSPPPAAVPTPCAVSVLQSGLAKQARAVVHRRRPHVRHGREHRRRRDAVL
jgi:hypothetical protein